MRHWLFGDRQSEATPQQRWASGASQSGGGIVDPIDRDYGYRALGDRKGGPREIPHRTREQARTDSIASYRVNPMARAILDTYVGFAVGDSGLTLNCSSDEVRPIAEAHWSDPRNHLPDGQELMLRTWMLMGEQLQEMMVGEFSGVCRRSPIDTSRILDVQLRDGNPLWHEAVLVKNAAGQEPTRLTVIDIDDISGLRDGEAFYWPGWRALETDRRGAPFLMPILDWLDSYDLVLSNLIDRTALMRYIAWDVTLKGDSANPDQWITERGGKQIPRSGTMEVHTESVEMKPVTAQTGAYEDAKVNQSVLTNIAGGAGLSKVWLAEPEDANRATSLTMAEPVRRRIGSVQNEWINNITEMPRFAVDRAVAAGRIDAEVTVRAAGGDLAMRAADTVTVTGPQIAAADSKITAEVLHKLSLGLKEFQALGVLSPEAAKIAAQKAWEDFCGIPYRSELDNLDDDSRVDDLAEHVDETGTPAALIAL